MRDLRTLLWVLFGVFVAAAALSAIPVIGSALAWILSILAFLAFLIGGAAITHDDASPPSTGGWGGSFNAWETADGPKGMVDLAYVYGRWVYDSFHDGWNELHPVHFMLKIGEATKGDIENGNWPDELGEVQATYDGLYAGINDPDTPRKQSEPPNDWTTHPLLDGCDDGHGYPEPDPSVVIH